VGLRIERNNLQSLADVMRHPMSEDARALTETSECPQHAYRKHC